MQPSILNKILKKTEEKTDYFLTLEICQDKVKTAACEIKGGEVEILAIGEKVYDGSWEEATLAADSAISQVEEKFAVEPEVNKVILGLPTEYTKDGKIEESNLVHIKELLKKLSLVPLGFVEVPFAIIHYLQKQEGGPQTLILVRIGQKLTVSLARVGKVTNNITVLRTDNLALDFEKAITSFAEVEVLPSRILLYDGGDLEKTRQDLINHPWLTRASFLHFPKIEIAPQDLDIKSIAYAAALEIAQVVEITEATEIEKPKVQEETPGFGFVKGEDILERQPQEMPPPPQFVSPQEAVPPLPPKRVLPKFTFPQFKLPPIQNLIAFLKARVSPVIPYFKTRIGLLIFLVVFLLLIVGSGVVAASWYIPTAQVNLILESQTLEQKLEVSLNPKLTAIDEANKQSFSANKEIPGLTLEIEEKGTKKAVTTAEKLVGEPAKGEVTIYNKTTNSKTFKKGITVIAPNELKFTLDEEVSVASASESVGSLTFGKQNARLTAAAIGPEGNLGVGQEFHFADFPTTSYSARNEVAFSGGTSREISVVGRSDQERLLASASAELHEQEGKLASGEKILEKTLSGAITQKKFDKEVDEEATELGLEISMKFSVLGFKENDLLTMLEKAIIPSIPAGFEFRRDEVKMEIVDFQKKKDGTVVIKVNFAVSLLPRINEEEIKKNLTGKNLATADNYLRNLGNIAGYEIKFGRTLPFGKSTLPRLAKNIKIETGSRK
ncbi:MAG: Uncharacterized protein LiPW16_2 [Microgenomates group bacterium LiPW_16]|nr:MAG: Uncharacterized protein LiPW16_2 [Microgenomates group bacterium LiPW_16]